MTRLKTLGGWALAVGWMFASGMVVASADDDPIFSGPQVGERLPALGVRGVFDEDAGQEFDLVGRAGGKPIVLIFVHDVNRQSIGMTRILSQYTVSRADGSRAEGGSDADGSLATGVIFLDDDATAAENQLLRIRHALTPKAPTGVSIDGREGPGSYGLNRNVMLTILVGKAGRVTANFALVQPSLQVDLPKVLQAIVDVAGGEVPKLSDLEGMAGMEGMTRGAPRQAGDPSPPGEPPNLRPLLAPLIRQEASEEQVDRAAAAVEAAADRDPAIRREIGRIANTIVDADKLENYGTPKAQEYLRRWATAFGRPTEAPGPAGNRPTPERNEGH